MKLLALDTSGEACSAALLIGEEIADRCELAPRRHAEILLPMIDALLLDAGIRLGDVDGIAFGRGPGSFTGLRIAAGVAQGLAYGADLGVAPVSSLAAVAYRAWREFRHCAVIAAFDARLGEVYCGAYRLGAGAAIATTPESVASAERVPLPETGSWAGAGSAWHAYGQVLASRLPGRLTTVHADCRPHARDVAILGRAVFEAGAAVAAAGAVPVYLREDVAERARDRG